MATLFKSWLAGGAGASGDDQEREGAPAAVAPRVELRKRTEVKLVVLGGYGVGRTSLIRRCTDDVFTSQHTPTIGVDVSSCIMRDNCRVYFWDIAFPEVFGANKKRFLHGADAVVLVFDPADRQSMEAIDIWRAALVEFAPPRTPIVLLANKSDDPAFQLRAADLDAYAERSGYLWWRPVSATERATTVPAVEEAVGAALAAREQRAAGSGSGRSIRGRPPLGTSGTSSPSPGTPTGEPISPVMLSAGSGRFEDVAKVASEAYPSFLSDLELFRQTVDPKRKEDLTRLSDECQVEYDEIIAIKDLEPGAAKDQACAEIRQKLSSNLVKWRRLVSTLRTEVELSLLDRRGSTREKKTLSTSQSSTPSMMSGQLTPRGIFVSTQPLPDDFGSSAGGSPATSDPGGQSARARWGSATSISLPGSRSEGSGEFFDAAIRSGSAASRRTGSARRGFGFRRAGRSDRSLPSSRPSSRPVSPRE